MVVLNTAPKEQPMDNIVEKEKTGTIDSPNSPHSSQASTHQATQTRTRPDKFSAQSSLKPANPAVTASTHLDILRKPAPPIPKKPLNLINQAGDPFMVRDRKNVENAAQRLVPPSEGRTLEVGSTIDSASANPSRRKTPALRALLMSQQNLDATPHQQHSEQEKQLSDLDGPPLPPRRPIANAKNATCLMDEDGKDASAIPSLQPQRRDWRK